MSSTTEKLLVVTRCNGLSTEAARRVQERGGYKGSYGWIVTKYLTSDKPYFEFHAMQPHGDTYAACWLKEDSVNDIVAEFGEDGYQAAQGVIRRDLHRQLVEAVYGMSLDEFDAAGGWAKSPSGSTWTDSLAWLPSVGVGPRAISLGHV